MISSFGKDSVCVLCVYIYIYEIRFIIYIYNKLNFMAQYRTWLVKKFLLLLTPKMHYPVQKPNTDNDNFSEAGESSPHL